MSENGCGSCSSASSGCKPGADGACPSEQENHKLERNMSRIKNKIVVMSGKGGVGKTSVAVNIAVSLALAGKQVGLLDVDVHGPSVPRLLSLSEEKPHIGKDVIEPVPWGRNLWVMSLGFMLPNKDDAVIWRGPVKMGLIKQFLEDVAWGDLDFLVVDCPPGTGDEPLSTLQTIGPAAQAVIVTTPQGVAVDDVRRSVTFCRQVGNPIIGIVENMSGFVCPDCGSVHDIFAQGGGEKLAKEMDVTFLGKIPMDPNMVRAADEGYPYVKVHHDSPAAQAVNAVVKPILAMEGGLQDTRPGKVPSLEDVVSGNGSESGTLTVAVPVAEGKLCMHFGHCQQFAMVEVDVAAKSVGRISMETPPPHEPGVLPAWCADKGVKLVLAGGMGAKAQSLFTDKGVTVVTGSPAASPETVVQSWLDGTLVTGANTCDH